MCTIILKQEELRLWDEPSPCYENWMQKEKVFEKLGPAHMP
jgi:hypothetical protein